MAGGIPASASRAAFSASFSLAKVPADLCLPSASRYSPVWRPLRGECLPSVPPEARHQHAWGLTLRRQDQSLLTCLFSDQMLTGAVPVRAIRRFTVRTALPEPLTPLRELMLNLRWSWHAETRELFAAIDPAGWEASGHDPVALLGEVPSAQLAALAGDQAFRRRLGDAADELRQYLSGPRWYQVSAASAAGGSAAEEPPPAAIAYF